MAQEHGSSPTSCAGSLSQCVHKYPRPTPAEIARLEKALDEHFQREGLKPGLAHIEVVDSDG